LGVNVHGNYYPNLLLSVVNYASIILATIIFILVYAKFHRAARKDRLGRLAGKAAPVV
jgi:hypothetical protein